MAVFSLTEAMQSLYERSHPETKDHSENPNCMILATPAIVMQSGRNGASSPNADEELDGAENALKLLGGKVEKVHKFNLPCDEGERTIIVIKKVKPTPKQYPRISGKIKSQPL